MIKQIMKKQSRERFCDSGGAACSQNFQVALALGLSHPAKAAEARRKKKSNTRKVKKDSATAAARGIRQKSPWWA
jgi:hypothetical protein